MLTEASSNKWASYRLCSPDHSYPIPLREMLQKIGKLLSSTNIGDDSLPRNLLLKAVAMLKA